MLNKRGEVKILDFGLAKLVEVLPPVSPSSGGDQPAALSASQSESLLGTSLSITKSGVLLGTPLYMAPECWRSEPAIAQSDVYSLGALLFELCAGRPPHHAESAVQLGFTVLGTDATPLAVAVPGVDSRFAAVVDRCLQRDATKRYASGVEVRDALERIAVRAATLSRRVVMIGGALLTLVLLIGVGLAIARDRQAKRQAELAQRMGQEISAMEWLLRTARQSPLHDLDREKIIIRARMKDFQTELKSYGASSGGLAHYALGRGHMALHEYPQALVELEQAAQLGVQGPEVSYALGVVLGKHFEQAMYEARLAGGGDWARKQLKELEPKYLTPAIAALVRSRAVKLDAPQYLEGLIAYYQRDYDGALRQAAAALRQAPWLYEARKLSGDVHLVQALQKREKGHYEEATYEFAEAVRHYEAAANEGRSDAEVYEGLAEAWVRQIEMAVDRGQSVDAAYAAAVAASDKISATEPHSIEGPLKKAFAAMMTTLTFGRGMPSADHINQCLAAAEAVLKMQPGHPYASESAANCYQIAATAAQLRGEDPEPLLRKGLAMLEPTVKQYPHFLWGLNDLGLSYLVIAIHLQRHGQPTAKESFERAMQRFAEAEALDSGYLNAPMNSLGALTYLISEARSDGDLEQMLARADVLLARCKAINPQAPQALNNYFQIYARAASRAFLGGQDPQPRLQRALDLLPEARKACGQMSDLEQHAALAHYVDAAYRVQKNGDPTFPLSALQEDLTYCFKKIAQDATCRTLAAQGEFVRADWLAAQGQPIQATLDGALAKAKLATESPETLPDAWQTLGESYLRLARASLKKPALASQHVTDGLAAVTRVFAINGNHAQALSTQGALYLLRAQLTSDVSLRRSAAQAAVESLEQALKQAPFLITNYAPLLREAQSLARGS